MVWVRERTTSTERPPLVGEVIANGNGGRSVGIVRSHTIEFSFSFYWRHIPLLSLHTSCELLHHIREATTNNNPEWGYIWQGCSS
jgi:hypothetical protein